MNEKVLKVIKKKSFTRPVIGMSVLLLTVVIYFLSISDKIIFPDSETFSYEVYTDKANGGNSQVLAHQFNDSILKYEFKLNDRFSSPYVGLSITPKQNDFINASKYNQVSIQISGNKIDRIGIAFFTPPLSYLKKNISDETLYHSYLNISAKPVIYKIPAKQLKFPEWWEDVHNISNTIKGKPDLSNVLHINISSAFSSDISEPKELEIYSFKLERNNRNLFFVLALLYLIFLLLLYTTHYYLIIGKGKKNLVTVEYQPLEIDKSKTGVEKCIAYINSHYSNSNLNLEIIAKETGITSRRITAIVQDKYNCNFKTYLNRIRINESQRLLKETELNIGEIAFTVGFNSQSHFNRVFKVEMQVSPSEFREKNTP